jgi:hypothetical protein
VGVKHILFGLISEHCSKVCEFFSAVLGERQVVSAFLICAAGICGPGLWSYGGFSAMAFSAELPMAKHLPAHLVHPSQGFRTELLGFTRRDIPHWTVIR